jgi:putative inorganic carbon (hco3(-)) transporter
MRSLVLLASLLTALPLTMAAPFVGVLLWCWLSFMSPHTLAYLPIPLPLVYVVAVTTIGAWLFSGEPKRIPGGLTFWLLVLFMIDMTLTTALSISPSTVWFLWNRNIKTMILAVAILLMMNNRIRLQGLVWIFVLSIGFYAVKGGLFVLLTAGSYRVQGPYGTMIGDNNDLGLAMIMVWPLMHYLRLSSEDRWVRLALLGAMSLSVFAIIGTYSRGAFLAFSFTLLYFWWKSKRKILFGFLGLGAIVPALLFMPTQWYDRMNTINTYEEDSSAQGRLENWVMALRIAADRPLTGIGFDAMVTPQATALYAPERKVPHVAHSIWFEPMADHGLPGLALFLAIGLTGFLQAGAVRKRTRYIREWAWAHDLATMSQLSLAGYFAAGTFLSMPYYDLYYGIIAMIACLHGVVSRAATAAAQRVRAPEYQPLLTRLAE